MRNVLRVLLVSVLGMVLFCEVARTEDYGKMYDRERVKRQDMSPEAQKRISGLESRVETLEKSKGTALQTYWDKGLRFESADKSFKLKVGGRLMWDIGGLSQDEDNEAAYGDLEGGTEFRRLRLYTSGDIYKDYFFKLQFDFAGGDVDLKDGYVGMKNLPLVGNIKAGHFKEPFGLEELTSSKYITFMERALPTEAFAPSRNAGLMVYNHVLDKKMTWALGIFRNTDDTGMRLSDDGYAITGRVTGCPWYADKGAKVLHLGVALSHRDAPGDEVRYRARPEWHLSTERFVNTGNFASEDQDLLGLEAALVYGPFSLQGEYMFARADVASSATMSGFYVQGSYWLTGEHRKYNQKSGCFSRVSPKKNFNLKEGGPGAWELAARYSHLDLNDDPVAGGELDNVTLGVNWHLNPNMRVMFNYVLADTDDPDNGNADLFGVRFQVDF